MSLAELSLFDRHIDLAPVLAEGIDEACRYYAELWENLAARPATEEGEHFVCDLIRDDSSTFSDALARLNRLANETVVDLNGRPFSPPLGITETLRNLHDNLALLANIRSYDELLERSLIPWEEIRVELDKPECREWMRTALAAYPVPEAV